MSDLLTGQGGWVATRSARSNDEWSAGGPTDGPASGRHAFNEDAVLTPIFHALTRGGWRSRQHEQAPSRRVPVSADPVDAFRRDPLTAPIPIQALAPVPPRPASGAHAFGEPRMDAFDQGRHHRRRESMGIGASR